MRVWLDARPLAHRGVGVGIYTRQLVEHLKGPELVLDYASMRGRAELPRINGHRYRFGGPVRWAMGKAWERGLTHPTLESFTGPVDLAHGTNYECPPTRAARRVATVHDLTAVTHPQWHTPVVQRMGRRLVAQLEELDRILTVSQHTADDVMRHSTVPASRIDVVHLAPGPGFGPVEGEALTETLISHNLDDAPYVLHVGSLEPRKNIRRLLDAFARAADDDVRLVLAAAAGWSNEDLFTRILELGLTDRVLFTGYVPPEDLPALYSGAEVVAYPSLYEGFGLPVIEAMACGAAVLSSDRTSIPEVAGDAAVLVDPEDTDALASELHRLLGDASARAELGERARKRSATFTWEKTAEQTVASYEKALAQ